MAKRHPIRSALFMSGAVAAGAVGYLWFRDRYQSNVGEDVDEARPFDIVDEAGMESFPASDPPAY